jgi:hypothetical protein
MSRTCAALQSEHGTQFAKPISSSGVKGPECGALHFGLLGISKGTRRFGTCICFCRQIRAAVSLSILHTLSPNDANRDNFRNVVFYSKLCTMYKVQKPNHPKLPVVYRKLDCASCWLYVKQGYIPEVSSVGDQQGRLSCGKTK